MKRVFVAINLPDGIKKELSRIIDKISPSFHPGVKFLSPENWHITIEFLSYQSDDDIDSISQAVSEIAGNFQPPIIQFERIIYGPVGKTPRMIWLIGSKETSKVLEKIKSVLEKKLFDFGIRFRQEHREFKSHLTLAILDAVSRENLPILNMPFNKNFEAQSMDLMESHLKRSGAQYELLSSFDFNGPEQ